MNTNTPLEDNKTTLEKTVKPEWTTPEVTCIEIKCTLLGSGAFSDDETFTLG
ncbi:MAG: hypothetical protein ACOYYS_07990 [Chloroflexota bacterium]